ncbi:MAG: four-helix bundle copper-binding protein [Bacteroidia bacterium]
MVNKTLVDELLLCAAECARCYTACQEEVDKEMLERCMLLDLDCEELCRLSVQVLERESENGPLFLKLCMEICDKCAEECEKHPKMEHCVRCAEACRKCANMCRKEMSHVET